MIKIAITTTSELRMEAFDNFIKLIKIIDVQMSFIEVFLTPFIDFEMNNRTWYAGVTLKLDVDTFNG